MNYYLEQLRSLLTNSVMSRQQLVSFWNCLICNSAFLVLTSKFIQESLMLYCYCELPDLVTLVVTLQQTISQFDVCIQGAAKQFMVIGQHFD